MADIIDGRGVAADIRSELTGCVEGLADAGERPTLATVLMSPDPASAITPVPSGVDVELP